MTEYIKAKDGPKNSVIYTDSYGDFWIASGGCRAWRNQNPGNLVPCDVTKRNGAIGKAGGFAVFPSYNKGHLALIDSLKNVHCEKNLSQLMHKFAPKYQNNTKRYIAFLKRKTGVKNSKKIKDFTPEEFKKLWSAIEQMEGRNQGKIEKIPKNKIRDKKEDKHRIIIMYKIDNYDWVSKKKAITIAERGDVDAIIVISKLGNKFLRRIKRNLRDFS